MSFCCFCYNIQHFCDLNHLSGCHINITDLFTRFQFNVNTLQCFLCILVHFCPIYKSCFGVLFLTAQVNVLGNCKICYQGLLLEYHSNALLIRIDDGCCYIRLTHVKHLSHGRSLNTTDQLHQSRFTGSVLTDQADHLAAVDLHINIMQNSIGSICFANAFCFK